MQLRGINANKSAQCADRSAVIHTDVQGGGCISGPESEMKRLEGGGVLNHLTDELNVFASLGQQLIPLMTVLEALELRQRVKN